MTHKEERKKKKKRPDIRKSRRMSEVLCSSPSWQRVDLN